jgi:hypothetical protein
MKENPKQKTDKEFQIPVADASSNPWAVVVVLFDADSTRRAMEGSRRAKDFTSFAISKGVVGFLRIDYVFVTPTVLLKRHRQVMVFVWAEEFFRFVRDFLMFKFMQQINLSLILTKVLLIKIRPQRLRVWNPTVLIHTRQNPWVGERCVVQHQDAHHKAEAVETEDAYFGYAVDYFIVGKEDCVIYAEESRNHNHC